MAKAGSVQSTPKYSDLKRRVLFLLGALIVFRIGAHIPVPGVDLTRVAETMGDMSGLLGMLSMFTGGALEKAAVFSLGIMPYITSSIVVQLLSTVMPQLEALKKEGESGRKKLSQYTRYGTVLVASIQGFVAAVAAQNQGWVVAPGPIFTVTAVLTLVAGALFLMWLGEQITERGIGNGISLLIFAGIVVGLPDGIAKLFSMTTHGALNPLTALFICLLVVLVTGFVVFVERGQRRVLINYAKRQVGNRLYGGQSSHVPLKLNMSGVMPAIFASSLMAVTAALLSGLTSAASDTLGDWLVTLTMQLSPGHLSYEVLFAALIIFFCYFYTALMFNPKDVADNLKKSGAFVPGIRPGQQTAAYLERVLSRLTLVGSIYIALICLLPNILIAQYKVPFYFGGTSLLIIVVVTMDFMSQVQANVMSYQYESLLKKANFKGNMLSR